MKAILKRLLFKNLLGESFLCLFFCLFVLFVYFSFVVLTDAVITVISLLWHMV